MASTTKTGPRDTSTGDRLTPEERDALVSVLTELIQSSRYPMSPQIERYRSIRNKLRGAEVLLRR
jgi:hypothetical protein